MAKLCVVVTDYSKVYSLPQNWNCSYKSTKQGYDRLMLATSLLSRNNQLNLSSFVYQRLEPLVCSDSQLLLHQWILHNSLSNPAAINVPHLTPPNPRAENEVCFTHCQTRFERATKTPWQLPLCTTFSVHTVSLVLLSKRYCLLNSKYSGAWIKHDSQRTCNVILGGGFVQPLLQWKSS